MYILQSSILSEISHSVFFLSSPLLCYCGLWCNNTIDFGLDWRSTARLGSAQLCVLQIDIIKTNTLCTKMCVEKWKININRAIVQQIKFHFDLNIRLDLILFESWRLIGLFHGCTLCLTQYNYVYEGFREHSVLAIDIRDAYWYQALFSHAYM